MVKVFFFFFLTALRIEHALTIIKDTTLVKFHPILLICVFSRSQPLSPLIKQPIKQAPDAEVLVVTTAGAQKTWPPAHPKPMARPMLVLPTLLPMLPTVVLQGRG